MNVSQVLWKAAKIIERDGWCQNTLVDPRGRVCILGALNKAETDYATRWGSESPYEFLRPLIGESYIAGWNNARDRTAEEVIDMLVIASIEAEQVKG